MNQKEKLIINKLFKLAESQQKVIQKLAQTIGAASLNSPKAVDDLQNTNPKMSSEQVLNYLKSTWTTAAVNSGVGKSSTPEIEFTPGRSEGNVQIGENYTVFANDVPNNNDMRKKLIDTFKAQIKSQKPELDGKIGIIFGKKPVR